MSVAAHADIPPSGEVRSVFHRALWEAEERALAEMEVVRETLRRAAEAAATSDARFADEVIARASELERRYCDVHDRLLVLIARHAPVTTDLRLAMALLLVNDRIQRMGAQCVDIATLCRAVPEGERPPPDQLECLSGMARAADAQIAEAARVFAERDVDGIRRLRADDQAINEANRRCFSLAVEAGGAEETDTGAAFRYVLMARAVERIGDNAVDVAHQAAFVATGELATPAS
jgi:phosphate transport system protein